MTIWDFDKGPFEENRIQIGFGWYHVLSVGYLLIDDAVIGADGTDVVHGTAYGLVVPDRVRP